MKKNGKHVFLSICIFYGCILPAQNTSFSGAFTTTNAIRPKHFISDGDIFGARNFIENKGQFENPVNKQEDVLFVYEYGGEKVYFTAKGLIYEQVEHRAITEEEREREEQGEAPFKDEAKRFYVNMNWVNPDPRVTVEKSEAQDHYFTYGAAALNAFAYKKITYKNVYRHIDIEYSIPTGKKTGIKYNVILHPGADAKKLKILYGGDVKKVSKNRNGEVIIKTRSGDIVEHAPSAFQSNMPVASVFVLKRDTILFGFPNGYKPGETLIIDPWVTTITTLPSPNSAFDVDYDFAGNTYVYGGSSTFKIAMYNTSGLLQWTFSGTLAAPAWSTTGVSGNFAVEKASGKCYTGQGVVLAGSRVIRLDAAGNYDNFITAANNQYREIWDMGFHCSSGELFIFGGTTSSKMSAATINSVSATLNLVNFQPTNTACCQDVVCYAIDDQGAIFVLYASVTNTVLNNKLCAVNPTFNGNLWTQPTGYSSMYEAANKMAYQPADGSNGFNALAVNNNYLFYYDGLNLAAYSKLTGASIATVAVPGLTVMAQGGIAADDCNHIYLGGNGAILTYSFNGTIFSSLTPIPLGVTTSAQNVYDLKLNGSNNTLYVCGTGFVGTYSTSQSCGGAVSVSNATACSGQSVTLVASGAASYTWSTGSNASSIVVTPTATSSYTLKGKTANACVSKTGTTLATVSVAPGPSLTVSSLTICSGETRKLTATGATSYTWNTAASTFTTSTISITPTVNTSYTIVGTSTAVACAAKKVVTVTVSACKGISEYQNGQIATIYPNPAKDKLNIALMAPGEKNIELTIYNASGRLVYVSKRLSFDQGGISTVDVGTLPAGIFFVNLKSGSSQQSIRLVKD